VARARAPAAPRGDKRPLEPSPADGPEDVDPRGAKQKIVWMDQRSHVLNRPDMYVGPIEPVELADDVLVATADGYACERVQALCSPALLKFLDEAVVNAIDNQRRDASQKSIRIGIADTGELTVTNDGSTVPIWMHEGTTLWKPTVVFSEFLSGSNFDDGEARYTGGRNGVGIKATNTWSLVFEVDIVSSADGKHFTQLFEHNMLVKHAPLVRATRLKMSRTSVPWMPDYARLGMSHVLTDGVSPALRRLLEARAYDAAACTRPGVSIYLNDAKVGIRHLQQYTQALGVTGGAACDSVELVGNVVLQVCATARAEGDACVVGFVNGVKCSTGTHMDMVLRRVSDIVIAKARAKAKDAQLALRPQLLRQEVTFVVSVLVVNPRFTSQAKEVLDTPVRSFGFAWDPSPAFCAALERSALVDRLLAATRDAEARQMQKSSRVTHRSVPRIDKYDPATGLFKRTDCSLIVTEGDSAKALAIAGLSVVGREAFGVFPLRGKLMNVTKFSAKKVMENAEISNLMAILGLEYGAQHDARSVAALPPYRRLVIFADQDCDGSHIAGLIMNFLHAHHRSLLVHLPDFIEQFDTPIVRLVAAPHLLFFSMKEFGDWHAAHPGEPARVKYYKGLGTSSNREAKDYFTRWGDHVTRVEYLGPPCDRAVDIFFNEKLADERKRFLSKDYSPQTYVDYAQLATSIGAFLRDEMSHFLQADNVRSLPSAVDGLKPVQRKVLFAFFERKQTAEVKVAQAGAMVAERTAYHRGETSVAEAIVGLAQDHVGTNNLALLSPEGQFGSRHTKPSEHATVRHIFTRLDPVARAIFRPEDDPVLEYAEDDGRTVEPRQYVPVIPMVLVNGATGIGTGWSTTVPSYNPLEVVRACTCVAHRAAAEAAAEATGAGGTGGAGDTEGAAEAEAEAEATGAADAGGADTEEAEAEAEAACDTDAAADTGVDCVGGLVPWYAGFGGCITRAEDDGTFMCKGRVDVDRASNVIDVTELPVGRWTEDFLKYVKERLVASSAKDATESVFVKSVDNLSTDVRVHVRLRCFSIPAADALDRALRLATKLSTTNMHLFDAQGRLRAWPDPQHIVEAHATIRLATYAARCEQQITEARHQLCIAANKKHFISEIIADELRIRALSHVALEEELTRRGFDALPMFAYLLQMSVTSMTLVRVTALGAAKLKCQGELQLAIASTPIRNWLSELKDLERAIQEYRERKASLLAVEPAPPRAPGGLVAQAKGRARGRGMGTPGGRGAGGGRG